MRKKIIAIASTIAMGRLCSSEDIKQEVKEVDFKLDNFYKPIKIISQEHRGKHRKSKYPYIK